jgi:predicted glycoside hydrolase/deacetylase ChbG (UPF0249 family)
MKELLIRADDLGFSEAVNYGILRTVTEGIIRSAGVMVNMDATPHAVRLFEHVPCCFGLHCNVSVGRPLCDAQSVPTLVQPNGEFHTGSQYRSATQEFASTEDLVRELRAQYHRFVELFGRKPAYFEAHAVKSKNLAVALEQVAREEGLFYQPSFSDFVLNGTYVHNLPMHSMEPDYDARAALRQTLAACEDGACGLYVCHPGYLDDYLLKHTSLTLARTDEVEMLCDPATKQWLDEHDFALISYETLRKRKQE